MTQQFMSDEESTTEEGPPAVELAALVVDALLQAKIVRPEDVPRAIAIAAEEIQVREVMGDLRFGNFPVNGA